MKLLIHLYLNICGSQKLHEIIYQCHFPFLPYLTMFDEWVGMSLLLHREEFVPKHMAQGLISEIT